MMQKSQWTSNPQQHHRDNSGYVRKINRSRKDVLPQWFLALYCQHISAESYKLFDRVIFTRTTMNKSKRV